MKNLIFLLSCLISLAAFAEEEAYTPPTELTADEVKNTEQHLHTKNQHIRDYWQARLALAKKNDEQLAKPGTPLKRPYYGDNTQHH